MKNINNKKNLSSSLSSYLFLFLIAIFFIFISFLMSYSMDIIKQTIISEKVKDINLQLISKYQNIKNIWLQNIINNSQIIVQNKNFIENIKTLIELKKTDKSAFQHSKVHNQLHKYIKEQLNNHSYKDIYVISRDTNTLCSLDESSIGLNNTIDSYNNDILSEVFSGKTKFIHPIYLHDYDKSFVEKDDYPSIFILIPIKDNITQNIIAAFIVRLNPYDDFIPYLLSKSQKSSMNFFAFDNNGVLVSNTIYDTYFQNIGLLKSGQQSILQLQLIDQKTKQPTALFLNSKKLQSGYLLKSYNDIRDEKVFGAWIWDNDLNTGFAVEIDESEVLEKFYLIKDIIYKSFFILLILTIILLIIYSKFHKKTNKIIEEEFYLRTIFNNVVDGIITTNSKGIIQNINPAVTKIFGYTEDELIGQNVSLLVPNHHQNMHNEYINNVIQTKKSTIFDTGQEVIGEKKDQSLIHVRLAINTYKINDEIYFSAIVQDLTKVNEINMKLKNSESKFFQIANVAHSAVIIVNEHNRITFWNKAANIIFGWESQNILYESIYTLFANLNTEELYQYFPTYDRQTFIPKTIELQATTVNNNLVEIEASIAYLKLDNEWNTVIIANDITKRKQNENELLNKQIELEKYNQELDMARKAALNIIQDLNIEKDKTKEALESLSQSREELNFAILEAQKANEAKSRFLATMSHEIRTPMNAIIGMSNLAMKTNLDIKQQSYIGKVLSSAEILLSIINDILDFSKIEAGKLTLENLEFDINKILGNITNLFAMKAFEKNIELIYDIDPKIPTFLIGDPLRLGQILTNLISNSLKFTPSGEIIVKMKAIEIHDNTVQLQISVTDTGIGLSQEQQKNLFAAFTQADDTISRKYGGTGLGLTITKQLVELMGGEIHLNSKLNKGTTFYFDLTLQYTQYNEKVEDKIFDNKNIILIDTNKNFRKILTKSIYTTNLSIKGVKTLQRAQYFIDKNKLANKKLDFVICDLDVENFRESWFEQFVNDKFFMDTKVIIMTNFYNQEQFKYEYENLHYDNVLLKPINTNEIIKIFHNEPNHQDTIVDQTVLSYDFSGNRFLLVEDNLLNQEVAVDILNQTKVSITLANNGLEALEILKNNNDKPFDCILMDMQMPVMDGIEATKQIKNIDSLKDIPILAMTANAMPEDKMKAKEIGISDYIVKPIDENIMFATIAKWVKYKTIENPILNIKSQINQIDDITANIDEQLERLSQSMVLDIQKGMKSTMKDPNKYLNLLKKFYLQEKDFKERFQGTLENSTNEECVRMAHSLKGLAGTIGAVELQKGALELEITAKESFDNKRLLNIYLDETLIELNQIFDEIKPLLELEETNQLQNNNQNENKLSKIRDLIDNYDTKALDLISSLNLDEYENREQNILQQVTKMLKDYDFDNALELIDQII